MTSQGALRRLFFEAVSFLYPFLELCGDSLENQCCKASLSELESEHATGDLTQSQRLRQTLLRPKVLPWSELRSDDDVVYFQPLYHREMFKILESIHLVSRFLI